ncbi:MAG: hypothetical protein ABUL73_05405 [Alphaproteobacteria bacterium]
MLSRSAAVAARQVLDRLWGRLRVVAVVCVCALAAQCKSTEVLTQAALASCGTSTAYLSGWWTNPPAQIDHDPFGGYVFVYWIDNLGNVCSGDPGVSGQVGPAVIPAQTPAASAAIAANAPITQAQLTTFQEIPISYAHYSASGLHFVQFYSTAFRMRADGSIWTTKSNGVFGAPLVADLGHPACIAPIAFKANQASFLPTAAPSGTQDPVRCRIKASPATTTMSDQELQAAHVMDLPHGGDIHEIQP